MSEQSTNIKTDTGTIRYVKGTLRPGVTHWTLRYVPRPPVYPPVETNV